MKSILLFVATFLILLLSLSHQVFAVGNICNTQGYTVVYVNGIFTNEEKARLDILAFQIEFDKNNGEKNTSFVNGYNESHLAGVGDLVQATSQAFDSPVSTFDRDTILMQIHPELKTQKILLVGHSQGTFYTNEMYDYLIRNGVPKESLAVYNIATPASYVAGGDGYLTSANDELITRVRELAAAAGAKEPLPSNILITEREKKDKEYYGHSLSEVYLAGASGRIVSDINTALQKLKTGKTSAAVENGCFNAPTETFSYNVKRGLFNITDPLAHRAYNSAGKTATAVATAIHYTVKGVGSVAQNGFSHVTDFLSSKTTYANNQEYKSEGSQRQGGAVVLAVIDNTFSENTTDEGISFEPVEQAVFEPQEQTPVSAPETPAPPQPIQVATPVPEPTLSTETSPVSSEDERETFLHDVVIPTPGFGGGGGASAVEGDTFAPEKPTITTPEDLSVVLDTLTVTIAGSAEAFSSVELKYGSGGSTTTINTSANSNGEWGVSATLSEGVNGIEVVAVDGSGNRSDKTSTTLQVVLAPDAPTVTTPADNSTLATSTITFIGTGTRTISTNFSSTTSSTDVDGNWQMTLSGFSEGTTTISFYDTDSNGRTSDATSMSISVDVTAPTITLTVLECANSLSSDFCLAGDTTLNLSWDSNGSTYSVVKNGAVVESLSNTTTTLLVTDEASTTIAIVAYDGAGNAATSTEQEVYVYQKPIIINEIAWMGTEASADDEWIELYNRTPFTLTLDSISLISEDGDVNIPLSGTVEALGAAVPYPARYLIEREDDHSVEIIDASLIATFSLDDNGEELHLVHTLGNATTTIDSTPAVLTCSGWCAGIESEKRSMERGGIDTDGTLATSWWSNDVYTAFGKDANFTNLKGTPRSANSKNWGGYEYYCEPYTEPYEEGGYYDTNSGRCTYLFRDQATPLQLLFFRGEVGSSTAVFDYSMSKGISKFVTSDTIGSPVQGEDLFVVFLSKETSSSSEINTFKTYFETGSSTLPHTNYTVRRWKYGVAP